MKIIMKDERHVVGDYNEYLLKYELVSEEFSREEGRGSYYGVRIYQYHQMETSGNPVLYDFCEVTGFSESLGEARIFFGEIFEGDAMPVSLFHIVDDWKCAFHEDYFYSKACERAESIWRADFVR